MSPRANSSSPALATVRRTIGLLAVGALALGVFGSGSALADKTKRLSAAEKEHYQALKVYMGKKQRKAYLKLKTEEERNAWLKERGLWDKFYQYDERVREAILVGDVKVGWEEDAVFMAWGAPVKRFTVVDRPASLSEEFLYRFEVSPEGGVLVWTKDSKTAHKAQLLYQIQLTVDDGRVARMIRTDCVPNWNFCTDVKWQKGE